MSKRDNLEPKYQPGKQYMLDGALLNEIIIAIRRSTPIAGDGLNFKEVPNGILLDVIPTTAGVTAPTGPFCHVYTDSGNYYLSGGIVMGGSGNEVVADILLGSVASPPADGFWVWVTVTGDAVVDDDSAASFILLPGFNVGSASTADGTNFPDSNIIPSGTSKSGTIHIPLGQWSGGQFIPAGCGNISVTHCLGSLIYGR